MAMITVLRRLRCSGVTGRFEGLRLHLIPCPYFRPLYEQVCYAHCIAHIAHKGETMAHKFSEGQEVRVREDAHLEDGVKQYRGRTGTIDHVVDSSPELTFYCVAFSGEWDKGTFVSCLGANRRGQRTLSRLAAITGVRSHKELPERLPEK